MNRVEEIKQKCDRVAAAVNAALDGLQNHGDNADREERWMMVAALQTASEAWGRGCNNQKFYKDLLALWKGSFTLPSDEAHPDEENSRANSGPANTGAPE